jgi:excisionase family DNA binding protein
MPATTVVFKPLALRKKAAAATIGCGTSKMDELIASGQIKAIKSGKQVLVLTAEIERFLASLPPATFKLRQRAKNQVAA